YTTGEVALSDREAVVSELGTVNAELNQAFWEVADGWHDAETGVEVEAVYWRTSWIEKMLDHVLVHHRPSNGYSTAHWHTIRHSVCLQDRNGWFAALQQRSRQPYPEQLQRAIIAWNHPVLGTVTHSYASQIRHAVQRGDSVSINHRLTELLASYFDVLFALNRMTHPGEKRLLDLAAEQCAMVPANMRTQVEAVLRGVPRRRRGNAYIQAKLQERAARYARYGDTVYLQVQRVRPSFPEVLNSRHHRPRVHGSL
ncbi:hypothetical protein LCGC14_1911080, partial [marine sediment metagenome]